MLDKARKCRNGAGMEESAPFGWRDDDRREEEGEPAGHRHYSVATSARERRGRVQRERVARVRVRERRGPPS